MSMSQDTPAPDASIPSTAECATTPQERSPSPPILRLPNELLLRIVCLASTSHYNTQYYVDVRELAQCALVGHRFHALALAAGLYHSIIASTHSEPYERAKKEMTILGEATEQKELHNAALLNTDDQEKLSSLTLAEKPHKDKESQKPMGLIPALLRRLRSSTSRQRHEPAVPATPSLFESRPAAPSPPDNSSLANPLEDRRWIFPEVFRIDERVIQEFLEMLRGSLSWKETTQRICLNSQRGEDKPLCVPLDVIREILTLNLPHLRILALERVHVHHEPSQLGIQSIGRFRLPSLIIKFPCSRYALKLACHRQEDGFTNLAKLLHLFDEIEHLSIECSYDTALASPPLSIPPFGPLRVSNVTFITVCTPEVLEVLFTLIASTCAPEAIQKLQTPIYKQTVPTLNRAIEAYPNIHSLRLELGCWEHADDEDSSLLINFDDFRAQAPRIADIRNLTDLTLDIRFYMRNPTGRLRAALSFISLASATAVQRIRVDVHYRNNSDAGTEEAVLTQYAHALELAAAADWVRLDTVLSTEFLSLEQLQFNLKCSLLKSWPEPGKFEDMVRMKLVSERAQKLLRFHVDLQYSTYPDWST